MRRLFSKCFRDFLRSRKPKYPALPQCKFPYIRFDPHYLHRSTRVRTKKPVQVLFFDPYRQTAGQREALHGRQNRNRRAARRSEGARTARSAGAPALSGRGGCADVLRAAPSGERGIGGPQSGLKARGQHAVPEHPPCPGGAGAQMEDPPVERSAAAWYNIAVDLADAKTFVCRPGMRRTNGA